MVTIFLHKHLFREQIAAKFARQLIQDPTMTPIEVFMTIEAVAFYPIPL